MPRDEVRRQWLKQQVHDAGLDAILAALPADVLLFTGYFPVVGTSLALATREGAIFLIVPEDEEDLAAGCNADRVITFRPGSLDRLTTAAGEVREPLRELLRQAGLHSGSIGCHCGEAVQPASYVAMHLYGDSLADLCPGGQIRDASGLFARMRATLTPLEIARVRRSCRIASAAYENGRARLTAGLKETEAAAAFRSPLSIEDVGRDGACRADGAVFCMSGTNASRAYGAYARSRATVVRRGDLVLTHCNSHADGYWTDITRTYCMDRPSRDQQRIYEAVFEARQAAFEAIRPGVIASEVDRAAREVMRSRGFADQFKHGTGHGVGFCAIDHNAMPRIHPKSGDVLETGMVFNVEPAAYDESFGGLRHCDMVAVTATAWELLTNFHNRVEDLIRS